MHQAFYRKWRPQVFDDVCGQEHITSILRYEAENHAFSHAYLFCGSRGTGKTTCAKILAKVVNCEHPVNGNPCLQCASCRAIDSGAATDVLEMDAASNNGVDNIRDIRDEVVYLPNELKYRVYIIDEVHMLSTSAFNALLKTLEEPPEHVIFILATTELQKLPATIISRCQRFDFRRISTDALMKRLDFIAKEEKINLTTDASRLLARLSQGGMRDAISLLELCAGTQNEVTVEVVEDSVGLTGRGAMIATVDAIARKDYDTLFEQISEVVKSSKDILNFWQDLISFYRDMLVVKTAKDAAKYLDLTEEESTQLYEVAGKFKKENLLFHCKLLEEALALMQKANAVKRVVAESTLLRLCDETLNTSSEAVLSRLANLEEQISTGIRLPSESITEKAEKKVEKPIVEKPAELPEIPKKPTSVPGAQTALRPIKNWTEVVERIGRSDPMTASFVRNSRGYLTADDAVLVRFSNAFSMQRVEDDEARNRLRAAVSAVLKRDVGDRMLRMEVSDIPDEISGVDEIVESFDNNQDKGE